MKLHEIREARAFRRLLTQEALDLIEVLKTKIPQLNADYEAGKFTDYTKLAELKDTFSDKPIEVYALPFELYQKWGFKGHGSAGVNEKGRPLVLYRIPMDDFTTIYHEIVHIFDPKLRKGISKIVNLPEIGQVMTTAHEVDAVLSSHMDQSRDLLAKSDPETRQQLLDDLVAWMKGPKGEGDLEPYNTPRLIAGLPVGSYYDKQKEWRRFISIVNNELLVPFGR